MIILHLCEESSRGSDIMVFRKVGQLFYAPFISRAPQAAYRHGLRQSRHETQIGGAVTLCIGDVTVIHESTQHMEPAAAFDAFQQTAVILVETYPVHGA